MLKGKRVTLRSIERSDIPTFVRWFNDRAVTRFLARQQPMSLAEEERWFEHRLENPEGFIFGIAAEDGALVGNIGLHQINWKDRHAMLGIVIGEKEYWGRGYGTDAISTMLRFAFNEQNLHRVWLYVYPENERALRCYERCGFQIEGREREGRFQDGDYRDNIRMSILSHEFAPLNATTQTDLTVPSDAPNQGGKDL